MDKDCQLTSLDGMHEPVSTISLAWQRMRKVIHAVKRRVNYVRKVAVRALGKASEGSIDAKIAGSNGELRPGDWVRIKSKKEIEQTLDEWRRLKGCAFMKEMWQFCGTEQRIFKKVRQFMDERDYVIKKTKGIYLLDNVYCDGAKDFGPCDRSCFYFWREEWLEKLPADISKNKEGDS